MTTLTMQKRQYEVALKGFKFTVHVWSDGYERLRVEKKAHPFTGRRTEIASHGVIRDRWVVEAFSELEAQAVFARVMGVTKVSNVEYTVKDLGPVPEGQEGQPFMETVQAQEATKIAEEVAIRADERMRQAEGRRLRDSGASDPAIPRRRRVGGGVGATPGLPPLSSEEEARRLVGGSLPAEE